MESAALRLPLDPVRNTQATYRVLLDALARPGLVRQLPTPAHGAPGHPWAAAVLLTLLDHETSLHTASGDAPLADFVRQRTAAPEAPPETADFVFATAPTSERKLVATIAVMKRGTLAYPDDSAALVLAVERLEQAAQADARPLALSGPGVAEGHTLTVAALGPEFLAARAVAVKDYPRGIDLFLVDRHGQVAGLPRSTRVGRAEHLEHPEQESN